MGLEPLTSQRIRRLRQELSSGSTSILCGAGISMLPPTSMPSGPDFLSAVLSHIATHSLVKSELDAFTNRHSLTDLVPELVLQRISDIVGYLPEAPFDIFRSGRPNHLHAALAHAAHFSDVPILTTNFDRLISEVHPHLSVEPIHLHGHIDDMSSIVATIRSIGKGVDNALATHALAMLDTDVVIVLGYSGNDRDIMQVLEASNARRIVWLVRTKDDWAIRNILASTARDRIEVLVGDLARLANALPTLPRRRLDPDSFARVGTVSTVPPLRQVEVMVGCLQQVSDYIRSVYLIRTARVDIEDDPIDRISLLCLESFALNRMGRAAPALEVGMQAFTSITDTVRPQLRCRVHTEIGLAALELNNPRLDLAKFHLESALRFAIECSQQELSFLEGRALHNVGYWHERAGDHRQALSFYAQSLVVKRATGDVATIATALRDIATLLIVGGRETLARQYLEEFFAITNRYSLIFEEAWFHFALGVLLTEKLGSARDRARNELLIARAMFSEDLANPGMVRLTDRYLNLH